MSYAGSRDFRPVYKNPLLPVLLAFLLFTCAGGSKAQSRVTIPGVSDVVQYQVDSSSFVHFTSIEVEGNKKTKTYLILREMLIKEGDSIPAGSLYDMLEHSRQLIYNTSLFFSVRLDPFLLQGNDIKIKVTVKEKWYIYPIPQFQLADRNFNEWIHTYNASLERVVYGVKFLHYNFSGRRDQLRLYLLNGYSRNITISYNAPYSNSKLTEGFNAGVSFTQNREITYKTSYYNKQLQYNNGAFVRTLFNANLAYQIRRGYYRKHVFQAGYIHYDVSDSVVNFYNPDYFSEQKSSMGVPEISYNTSYIHVNNVNYPLEGKIWSLSLIKRGVNWKKDNSYLALEGSYSRYLPHGKNWFSSFQAAGKIKLPYYQPFINQKAFGYEGYYLRGMEYYVVDGVASALAKYTLRKKLFSFSIPMPFHIRQLPYIPFEFYAKVYGDAGYCHNNPAFRTRFNEIFLYTGGIGLDILSVYDFSLRLEYSMDQLGEKGIFLHTRGGF